uniref:Minor tail protein n=1 Tax=Siphoviridae sp. cttWj13 TaxID=2826494 RepID=A0A8S5QXX2_9CAUD|nr:MAG TPA: minor tail protein [Siphoviridae sp. cttWj13]
MSMGMNISAGTIMAYMDLDMSSFNSAIDMAGEQLSGFASGGVADALGSIGAAAETAGRALTMHITGKLLDVGQAALQVGMNFDASMSNVYGLMSSLNLSQAQMDALRDTAREMGATTKFSASEAADAMGYMALAGWDDAQVIAGIPGVLNLAAAANMDLAKASDIVTDTMTPFGMAAERAGEAADVFAYAQANSNTTVEGLGEAMKYAAPTADAFGMTLQDTAAAMGVLANAGIKGSQGGTTLNAMLRDMKNNAKNGAIAIGKTKVALTNADGSYRSYAAIIRDIDKATSSMTASQRDAALGAIFGDESLKGILATLKQGPDALDAMTEGMYACGGAAADMAATMGDNLKGDLAILESGAQDMAIALSDWLMPAARGVVQGVTDLIGKFNALDDGTKNTIFRIGAMAAAAGPLLLNGGKVLTLLSGVNPLVVGLGAAAALAYTHSDALQGMVAKLGDGVTAFGAALESGAGFTAAFSAGLTAAFGEEAAGKVLGAIEGIKTAISTVGDVLTTVTDAVGTFFGALFDGEGLKQSWDNAAAVISGYDWTALGTSIISGVTGALDAAGEWLKNIFTAGLTAAKGVNWFELGTSIHDGIQTILDTAGGWLKSLFEAGKTAAGEISWADIGTAIWNGVTGVLDMAGSFLSGLFGLGKDSAIADVDWSAIGTAIWNGVTGVLDAAGSWLSSLFGLGKSAAEGLPWSEVGTAIQTGVGTVLDAAGSWLYAGFEAAKTYIGNLNWGEVGTAIQTGVGTVLDTAGTWLSSGFEAAKTAISGIDWGCVGSTISSGISGAIDGLAKLGSGIWDTITGWFGGGDEEKAKGDAKTSGGNLTTGMETGITEGSAAVTTAATNAASSAMTAAAQTLTAESGTTITETWVGGMVTGIANQNPILTLGVQTLGDNAVTTATDTLTADAGKTIANSFVGGICSAVAVAGPILNVQMQTTAGDAAAKAGAALSYTQGYDIGVNMVRGITAGVRSTSGELYSQMVQMARTAVSRTKSALRIHSPSGVFADEVGAWIPGGIGEGVLSREDDALGPLEEVRASMVDTMTGALSGIDTGWPDAPWNPGGGGGRTVTVTINVTGDWHVRSEQEKQEIISELGERVREELRGL